MSQSAPWSYQGTPANPGYDTGQVKMFDPANPGSDPGQVKMFDPSQMQGSHQPNVPMYNGQPENQAHQGQGYYSQGQEQNGTSEQQNYQGHYHQYGNGQMNYGYDPSQNIDPNQQFYYKQYWDPNLQVWRNYDQQSYGQYQGQGQQWTNAEYDASGGNVLNVHAEQFVPNNYQQPGYDTSQGQGHVQQEQIGQGHGEEDSLDQSHASVTSESSASFSQSNDTSGLGGFFHGDSVSDSCGTSMNSGVFDDRAKELERKDSEQGHIQSEFSNESLRTVNYSSASLPEAQQSGEINAVTSQLLEMSVTTDTENHNTSSGQDNVIQTFPSNVPHFNQQPSPPQQEGVLSGVPETSSGGSQHSEGLSDWEVVPPQTLSVPGHQSRDGSNHSREGSIDNNVQFFIGSSRNSDEGTPESFMQGQQHSTAEKGNESKRAQETSQPQGPPKGDMLGIATDALIPQHTSSPNMSPAQKPHASPGQTSAPPAGLPPMPPKVGPPKGLGEDASNPFRRDKGKLSNYTTPQSQGHSFAPHSTSQDIKPNEKLMLDVSAKDSGIPSPIMSSSEETVTVSHPNTPPVAPKGSQSPILPRKESPFQPPSRRRTLSGQSSGSIEEKPQLESQLSNEGSSKQQEKVPETREKSASISSQSSKGSLGRGETAKPGEKTLSDRDRELSKYQERIKKASRPPPGPHRGVMSPRRMESAFQQVQKQRAKHNMSPATSLWAGNDLVLPQTNILLAPAAPASGTGSNLSSTKTSPAKSTKETRDVLSPVQMLITSLSEKQSKESTPERGLVSNDKGSRRSDASKSMDKKYDMGRDRRETRRDVSPSRERHERGSSIDRELEISRKIEDRDLRKERDDYYRDRERDYYRDDRYRGRDSRGPRDPRDRDPRDRDPRDRDYDPYNDRRYRDRGYHGDERYDRPRSRHSLLDEERSSSRQGSESERPRSRQDSDRPRSRQEYGRDYYYRDKYGRVIEEIPEKTEGYDYDRYYGRGYYDRHGYYDNQYYDNRYYRYDDYYSRGNNYDESFNRLLQFDGNHGNWPYYGYPGQYNDSYGPPYEEGYRQSQRSGSRVHTPGSLSDAGEHPDYGYQYGSRSSSRQGYDDYARSQWEAYYANYNRGYGYQDPYYQEEVRPGRMTPAKHSIPHLCVRFGPGGHLVKVLPNRPADGEPATVEIHDISQMLQDNPETDELKSFPGPLVRGDTHKNDVLVFCQRKAKECLDNVQMMDRESAALIWKYLELLIKQNGTFVGTDVADLLLEGHEPTTVDYSMMGLRIQSQDNLDEELNETTETNFSMVTADRSIINRGNKKSVEEVTDRFRHLLLYGRKKDALEWAMKNGLWGHALFLASKMDSRAHANVMTRFANNAMKMNDPLQTLYQLMSGRQPAAVTCITDEKWGDWRPHLAMILSNHSSRLDLDRKSIMTLGDTLASKGFLHASHLCYVMAQCNFGSYQKKTSKMVLIGSNHSLPLKEFATNEAIHCTEIYQYGISLGNPNSFSANFQYFKFLYACRLSENGFAQEALQYLEVIARVVQQSPTLFQPALVKLVYEFANRLKYFDPQRQHSGEETEDPFWLQQLQRINNGFMDGSIQPISGSVTPYGAYGLRAASTESGEVANYTTGADNLVTQQYTGFPFSSDISQQSGQVVDQSQYQQPVADQGQHQVYQGDVHQNYHQNTQYQHQGQVTHIGGQTSNVEGQTTHVEGQTIHAETQSAQEGMQTDQHQQWQQYYYNQGQHYNQYQDYGQQGDVGQQGTDSSHTEGNIQQQSHSDVQDQMQSQPSFYQPQMHQPLVPSNQHMNQRGSISSTANGSIVTDDDEEEEDENEEGRDFNDGGNSNFSYFDNIQQTQIVAPRLRKRTESEASNASGDRSHRSSSLHDSTKIDDKSKEAKKPQSKQQNQPQQQGKGILGGIMNKLWGNKKNEMKLPDDTKKSIVWDAEKKKWKNLDADEEDDKPPPPPPKDTPSAAPVSSESTMGPPPANKFSLRRGAASRYVDVMNSKPAPTKDVPQSLFNVMPSSHSSPAIFSPGGPGDDSLSSSTADHGQPQLPAPQESTNTAGENSTDSSLSSLSSLSKEVAYYMAKLNNQKTDSSANGMPVMFNPAQFQNSQSAGSFQSGSNRSSGRLRPGQRRQYPK